MGLKRVTARIEVTYPADDPRTLEELRLETPVVLGAAVLAAYPGDGPRLASYNHIGAAVDPDPEPTLPDPEPDPRDQVGRTAP